MRGLALGASILASALVLPSGCGTGTNPWVDLSMRVASHSMDRPLGPAYPDAATSSRAHALAAADPTWKATQPADWRFIVIHHSATTWGNAARFHRDHLLNRHWENGLGYHFVIGNGSDSGDGQIEVGPRWARQIPGAHAGVRLYNEHGIGVCLVGNFERGRPSASQMVALRRLVRYLQARYDIPRAQVISHGLVKPTTQCPGRYFSMAALRGTLLPDRLEASSGMPVSLRPAAGRARY